MRMFEGEHSSSQNGGWTSKRNTGRNEDAWSMSYIFEESILSHDGNLVAILRHERDIIGTWSMLYLREEVVAEPRT